MKNNDDKLSAQIRQIQYPGKIDLVSSVMESLPNDRVRPNWWKMHERLIITAAAASVALLLSVNVIFALTKSYNEPQICDMMAEVYDDSMYGTSEPDNYFDMELAYLDY